MPWGRAWASGHPLTMTVPPNMIYLQPMKHKTADAEIWHRKSNCQRNSANWAASMGRKELWMFQVEILHQDWKSLYNTSSHHVACKDAVPFSQFLHLGYIFTLSFICYQQACIYWPQPHLLAPASFSLFIPITSRLSLTRKLYNSFHSTGKFLWRFVFCLLWYWSLPLMRMGMFLELPPLVSYFIVHD